ncbi:hypothetical protein [Williamsoniiplasma lucivorax]|uniref:Uncharacterized protein n=1 Tax=Williamsoniiplasma lucivorax TaxID=209274 RepID=A0A2S5RDK1_9MOLU|nr:hypothetical protein [Williamsoniiplasma lucivorax]PPE05390.1 hypothetical protein ELUCI_v1c04820 [Williamsoniiplasma lucivorax]
MKIIDFKVLLENLNSETNEWVSEWLKYPHEFNSGIEETLKFEKVSKNDVIVATNEKTNEVLYLADFSKPIDALYETLDILSQQSFMGFANEYSFENNQEELEME